MQTGMTKKQFAAAQFWRALSDYEAALRSKDTRAIILTSLRIHAAKGWRLKTLLAACKQGLS